MPHERFAVKNLNGTSKNKGPRDSWIAFWRRITGSQRTTCVVLGCGNTAVCGAHVKSVDRRMRGVWYIVPFCAAHNHYTFTDTVVLDKRVAMVPADRNYL